MQTPHPFSNYFDPEKFREQGHQVVDLLAKHLKTSINRDVEQVLPWQDPNEKAHAWQTDFSSDGKLPLLDFLQQVLRQSIKLHHPRYVGHQVTSPLPVAALFDFVADFLNNSTAVYEMGPVGTVMEINLIKWLGKLAGFCEDCGGVLTSGGTLGNLTALLAARQVKCGYDIWNSGISSPNQFVFLVSRECHYSIERAVKIMGFGGASVIDVQVDGDCRMDLEHLNSCYRHAVDSGKKIVAVVANACSTATGAFDPLLQIGEFCREHDFWFHVDGAHGGSVLFSQKYRHLLEGVEMADSLVWDAHKMALLPALITAVIFKNKRHADLSFAQHAPYLLNDQGSIDRFNQAERTLECTKRMMALKFYGVLKTSGSQIFSDYVDHTFDLARTFSDYLKAQGDFELPCEIQSNIVCFRLKKAPLGVDLDDWHARIRKKILETGRFYIVQTKLSQGLFLRVTIMNPLTTFQDLKDVVEHVRETGKTLE